MERISEKKAKNLSQSIFDLYKSPNSDVILAVFNSCSKKFFRLKVRFQKFKHSLFCLNQVALYP